MSPVNWTFWEQFGPWAVLAIILLAAIGWAGWKVYERMANALDSHYGLTVQMGKDHAAAIERMNQQQSEVINNNTKAITTFSERFADLDKRVESVEFHLRKN